MIYRHTFVVYKLVAFLVESCGFKLKGHVRPATDGACAVLADQQNGVEYVLAMHRVKSEKIVVPNTPEQLLKQDGI